MKLQKLFDGLDLELTNHSELEIKGITDDSRNVKPGFIFFAINGSSSNGHKYINAAIEKGAVIVIHQSYIAQKTQNIIYIRYKNIRKALALLCKNFYDNPSSKFKLIGVTGTNGKTTITSLIFNALRLLGQNAALIGTNNIQINDKVIESTHTTPGPVELNKLLNRFVYENIDFVIMEVSSHSLDQYRVYGLEYDIATFSNLTQDHLDYHGNMKTYAEVKRKLFHWLDHKAIAISNLDDQHGNFMIGKTKANTRGLSQRYKSNFKIDNIKIRSIGTKFELNNHIFNTKLIGEFNVYNMAIAIAALYESGFKYEKLVKIVPKVEGAEGRMQTVFLKNGAIAIVDYAHTPDGLEKALKTCRNILQAQSKLICVFGAGGDRDITKRPLMGHIALKNSDFPIVTSDNPRTEVPEAIIQDIVDGMASAFTIQPDRSKAIKIAMRNSNKNDIILIAGKGHEKYQIIGSEKIYFSDLDEIERYNLDEFFF